MGFAGCVPRFLKAHGGWVMTVLNIIGLVGTVILVADEAPKVKYAIADARMGKWAPDEYEGEAPDLTTMEKIKIALPIYIPAIVLGTLTVGGMIGNQVYNNRKQLALLGTIAMMSKQMDAYRDEVRSEVGDEKEKEMFDASRKKVKELQEKVKMLEKEKGYCRYTISTLPGVIFQSTPAYIEKVFHHLMYNLINCGAISLAQVYDFIGIPTSLYDRNEAENYGWEAYENEITYGSPAVDFEITDIIRKDGEIIHLIDTYTAPYELGLDYGMTDSSVDHIYLGHNPDMAETFALQAEDADTIIWDSPEIYVVHSF